MSDRSFGVSLRQRRRRRAALTAEARYESACTVEVGLVTADNDPLMLPRIPVSGHDTIADFVCRLRAGRSIREAYLRWRKSRAVQVTRGSR
jgi:hypothetical protein